MMLHTWSHLKSLLYHGCKSTFVIDKNDDVTPTELQCNWLESNNDCKSLELTNDDVVTSWIDQGNLIIVQHVTEEFNSLARRTVKHTSQPRHVLFKTGISVQVHHLTIYTFNLLRWCIQYPVFEKNKGCFKSYGQPWSTRGSHWSQIKHEPMNSTLSSFQKKSPILTGWTGCQLRLKYLWPIWHGTFCRNLRRQLGHRMGEPYICEVQRVSHQEPRHKGANHQDLPESIGKFL